MGHCPTKGRTVLPTFKGDLTFDILLYKVRIKPTKVSQLSIGMIESKVIKFKRKQMLRTGKIEEMKVIAVIKNRVEIGEIKKADIWG